MFPIALDLSKLNIALIGNSEKTENRLKQLDSLNAERLTIYSPEPTEHLRELAADRLIEALPTESQIKHAHIIMIVDLIPHTAAKLANDARQLGTIVNVEDVTPFCDFFFMSQVRQGDLLIGISTNGKSPTIAIKIKEYLRTLFSEEWAKRLRTIGQKRKTWQQQGLSNQDIMTKTEQIIEEEKWLPQN